MPVSSSRKNFVFLFISLVFLGCLPRLVAAESATGCHCFRERDYNPSAKFAADEYLLATTFNSLISKYFAIPKREVVMLKMQGGMDENDLLIGHYIAKASGSAPQALLDQRRNNKTWQAILSEPKMASAGKGNPLLAAIKSGIGTRQGGGLVAEKMIADFFAVSPASVAALRADGLDVKEAAVVMLLAQAGKTQPRSLVDLHRKKGQSWSEIAHGLGIEPAAAGKRILDYHPK